MKEADETLSEYDFSGGTRGRFAECQKGTDVVLLDEDVVKAFPGAASVDQALRLLIEIARDPTRS